MRKAILAVATLAALAAMPMSANAQDPDWRCDRRRRRGRYHRRRRHWTPRGRRGWRGDRRHHRRRDRRPGRAALSRTRVLARRLGPPALPLALSASRKLRCVERGVLARAPRFVLASSRHRSRGAIAPELLGCSEFDFARALQIELPANRIVLRLPEGFDCSFKITKAFSCPLCPGEGPIERSDHGCASIEQ